jgi:diacylglycerol kinase family enzyme
VRRAAVVIHPAKHDDIDGFRATVSKAMADCGWAEPLWLETRPDDTGERLAREAVRSGVDLVLASGGDGTITACAGGIAGTRVPLGVLPCGTGNLLARNLGLPLSLDEALAVALTGSNRRLDVGTDDSYCPSCNRVSGCVSGSVWICAGQARVRGFGDVSVAGGTDILGGLSVAGEVWCAGRRG